MFDGALLFYCGLDLHSRQFTLQSAELFFRRFLCGESFAHYFRPAEGTVEVVFAVIIHLFPACLTSHFIVPFFVAFVFFVA
jgi:hypothetical protein